MKSLHAENAAHLALIERAVFMVSLDDYSPATHSDVSHNTFLLYLLRGNESLPQSYLCNLFKLEVCHAMLHVALVKNISPAAVKQCANITKLIQSC